MAPRIVYVVYADDGGGWERVFRHFPNRQRAAMVFSFLFRVAFLFRFCFDYPWLWLFSVFAIK